MWTARPGRSGGKSRLRVAAAMVPLVAAVLVTAGCGGKDEARTGRIDNPVRPGSVSSRVGDIRLQLVRIQRPEGKHATGARAAMFLTLANGSDKDDEMTAVSSVDARKVVQRDGDSAPEPRISVTVPAHGTASLQHASGLHLELAGLKRDLPRRNFVPVTFRFADNGTVTVQVFVQGVDHPVVSPLPSTSP